MKPQSQFFLTVLFCAGVMLASTAAHADDPVSTPRSLFTDRRARGPGDIVTVLVSEIASVSSSAQTRLGKSESASANLMQRDGEIQLAEAGFDSRFAGGGQIERSGTLLARITVRIEAVDAQGNFYISGEQLIAINNEKQRIQLSGLVRPDDISADNTVPSWRVSGTNIELKGRGILSRRASPGWLTRLLSFFGQ
jgi:flagellar L-ring protein precursor FlgH